jgi:hypothetical protein
MWPIGLGLISFFGLYVIASGKLGFLEIRPYFARGDTDAAAAKLVALMFFYGALIYGAFRSNKRLCLTQCAAALSFLGLIASEYWHGWILIPLVPYSLLGLFLVILGIDEGFDKMSSEPN